MHQTQTPFPSIRDSERLRPDPIWQISTITQRNSFSIRSELSRLARGYLDCENFAPVHQEGGLYYDGLADTVWKDQVRYLEDSMLSDCFSMRAGPYHSRKS